MCMRGAYRSNAIVVSFYTKSVVLYLHNSGKIAQAHFQFTILIKCVQKLYFFLRNFNFI